MESNPSVERPLCVAEKCFLICLLVSLTAAPWMLGQSVLWSQWIGLALATTTFFSGLWAWLAADRLSDKGGRRTDLRAFRWILVFLGSFLVLVWIQSWNPSYEVQFNGKNWQLRPLVPLRWLPSGLDAPFDKMEGDYIWFENSERYLLIFGISGLIALGAALGLQRGRLFSLLGWAAVIHLGLISLVCIAHSASHSNKVLWVHFEQQYFLGAPFFPYKNQNAAYHLLVFGGVLGAVPLMWSRLPRAGRVALVVACLLGLAALTGLRSRFGLVFGFLLAGASCWTFRGEWSRWRRSKGFWPTIAGVGLVLLVGFSGYLGEGLKRMANEGGDWKYLPVGGKTRARLQHVSLLMWNERPWLGWGGGAYLYLFPVFHDKVPEIAQEAYGRQPSLGRFFCPHGDGDWAEFLAEYGCLGTGLLLLTMGVWLGDFFRYQAWRDPVARIWALTLVVVAYHGLVDHVLRNPAVFTLWLVMAILLKRYIRLERRRLRDLRDASRYRMDRPEPGAREWGAI